MSNDIQLYNSSHSLQDKAICEKLSSIINTYLSFTERKVWHAHPVWFIEGNPIVGYSKQKAGIRLMFWSGMDFEEDELTPGTGKFKDASIFYTSVDQIDEATVKRCLEKAEIIQWDYKNIIKNKGVLKKI